MKFLNHRGYLSNVRGTTATGNGSSALGDRIGAGRNFSNTPGGVAGFTPSKTQIKLGNKSTQVSLSSGAGARRTGWAGSVGARW